MLCCSSSDSFNFFFFQAEDGIRDLTVTGVQTCALPICPPRSHRRDEARRGRPVLVQALEDRYPRRDRKSTRLNSSHSQISYAVFCLKKKKDNQPNGDMARRGTSQSLRCRTHACVR